VARKRQPPTSRRACNERKADALRDVAPPRLAGAPDARHAIVESYDTLVTLRPLIHRLGAALLEWLLPPHRGAERLACAAAVRASLAAAECRAARSRNATGARDDGWDFLGAGV
jgi:hypothetical protein